MRRLARVVVLLTAGLLAAIGVYVWSAAGQPACPADATALLLHASASPASVQPRWTGCFDRPLRSVPAPTLLTNAQVRGAVGVFELAFEDRRLDHGQDLGVARTLSGESERGLATLTTEGPGDDPDALSNVAGAYLMSAARTGSARDVALALDHASHALALSPSHAPAVFNQALALTMFGLAGQARSAWLRYLALDTASQWVGEARAGLAALADIPGPAAAFDERFARPDWDATTMSLLCQEAPQTCRERLEEKLLPAWARAHVDGDAARAASLLTLADTLAFALRARGDALDAQAVEDLRRAVRRREPRLADAAAGLIAYGDARTAFEDDRESIPLFVEAERRLGAASNPLHGWAQANRIYAEFTTYNGERLDAVEQELQTAVAAAMARGHGALAGRLLYLQSLTFANRANYAAAEPLFRDSLEVLQHVRESGHLAATQVLVADTRMRLGESDAGWQSLRDAVKMLNEIASARRRYAVLLNVGLWMTETRMPYAAVQVLTSARDTAIATNQHLRVAESSLIRARAYASIGNIEAARDDLVVARPDPARNGRWGTGRRARHEYLAGVAEVERDANPRAAIAAATEALSFFDEWQYAERVAPLYLLRGRAYAAAGDWTRAEEDFAAGVSTYQAYRQTIPTVRQRLLSQDVVWDLYEERLRLAARRSPDAAFEAAEEARGRTLLESLPGAHVLSSAAVLQRLLIPAERIVYYALLPRELLIWAIATDEVVFERVAVDRTVLERRVVALQEALQRDAPEKDWEAASQQLFDMLLAPIQRALPAGTAITIMPDGALHRLPFAALRDRRSGAYLVDSHALTTAPSATLLAWQRQHPRPAARPATVFAVTDPAPAGAFAALPGSAREGRSIARLYDSAEVVSRDRATKAAFLLSAPKADVVHFAGHAVANPRYPLMAHLQFSAEPAVGASPTLDATEIASMRLEHTRLVVLAACTTGGGQVRRGEGVLSLARPFLIAGAPAVVATLWDIDDAASAAFLSYFHERFTNSGNAASALRDSQRWAVPHMRPSRWAAFVVVGQSGGGDSQEVFAR